MSLDALARAALLGTARQAPAPVDLPGGLAGLRGARGVERDLLRDAAALSVYREAGALPRRVAALPAPAPDETREVCPPAVAGHLLPIVDGPYAGALGEWLDALAATGAVIPHTHVRALLELGNADAATALRLEPVLSERARWLADEHGWGWAQTGARDERWATGSRAARLHLLRSTRRTDPDAGRELVESTWSHDAARDREAFLAALTAGLGMADEPFLEAALDDRAQTVRARAAELLAGLPESRFAQRMAERVAPLIGAGRLTLPDAQLPDEVRRDGITDTPPRGFGVRAWVLSQLVAAAPLRVWGPEAPPASDVDDGLGELLHDAWALAATRQRNRAWADALLQRGASRRAQLMSVLDRDAQERHVLARDGDGERGWPGVPAGRWSATFTAAIAEQVAAGTRGADWDDALACHGDPTVEIPPPAADPVAGRLRAVAAQLAFRRLMLDTFKEITTT